MIVTSSIIQLESCKVWQGSRNVLSFNSQRISSLQLMTGWFTTWFQSYSDFQIGHCKMLRLLHCHLWLHFRHLPLQSAAMSHDSDLGWGMGMLVFPVSSKKCLFGRMSLFNDGTIHLMTYVIQLTIAPPPPQKKKCQKIKSSLHLQLQWLMIRFLVPLRLYVVDYLYLARGFVVLTSWMKITKTSRADHCSFIPEKAYR